VCRDKTQFASLVRYVVRQSQRGRTLNIHWRPQTSICRPCYVRYQFVGHYDTLLSYADDVLRHIARSNHRVLANSTPVTPTFPRVDPDNRHHTRSSRQLAEQFYTTLDRTLVDWLQSRLYALDYRLFAFTPRRNLTLQDDTFSPATTASFPAN